MNDILEHDVSFFQKTSYSSICWRNKIEIYHPYQENVRLGKGKTDCGIWFQLSNEL